MDAKKSIFVIMPFSKTEKCTEAEWTEIYENVFKPAIEACGYKCERAVSKTGSLIKSIVESLKNSYIVLADITDRNPNVFYELGVRHTLRKRTIVVCQNTREIPSDLRGYWSIKYGIRPKEVDTFKKNMKRLISEIEKDPERSDSPVSDYLESEQMSISSHVQRENIKKLGALYTEFTENINCLSELLSGKETKRDLDLISFDCLQLLLTTYYIDLGPDFFAKSYELYACLRKIRSGDVPNTVVMFAWKSLRSLSDEILDVRKKLLRGDYSEPPVVTTMKWVRPESICESKESSCFAIGYAKQSCEGLALAKLLHDNKEHPLSKKLGSTSLVDKKDS